MNCRPLFLISCLILQSIIFTAMAQEAIPVLDSVSERIHWLKMAKGSATLFVHFDKNIYSNNETAWFTTYILNDKRQADHHTLSVALIRNDDRSVLTEARFVAQNGVAFGNIFLPDSLPTGDYNFLCYTNDIVNGYPSALFVQPVTIKSDGSKSFTANMRLKDSAYSGLDSTSVLLKAYEKDYTLVKGGQVKYFIGNRSSPLRSGILKTDRFGEATIPIPLNEITASNNILQAEISNGSTIKNFSIKLPVYKKHLHVSFYPEGGHLVNNAQIIHDSSLNIFSIVPTLPSFLSKSCCAVFISDFLIRGLTLYFLKLR